MRKRHTAEFKAKVAIEAVKGLKTINEIAAHFEVAPTQVSAWKKQFLEASAETFKA
ncbi:MAG: helix-turn-helix domain-containing protein, partial [Rikenellaceae bacterium]